MEAAAREQVTPATTGGVTVVGSDAPSDYHIAPRSENPTANPNPTPGSAPAPAPTPQAATAATFPAKKKRGRPRKYGPDGTVTMALSPKPISSAAPSPPVIDFSGSAEKQRKMKPASSVSKSKYELENLGEWVACSVGANFTPHIITVNTGEDVTMKIISFSQQGPRAICILSANGVISSVTLRQPDSSGGTLTYEGRFEILSLSGSFMPSDSGGTRSRSGGMSVSLASPDGRVVGGGVAGLLVAASPVQVVVGSFLAGNQHEQKPKKQKHEPISIAAPTAAVPISSADPKGNFTTTFRGDSWSPLPSDSRSKPTDINASQPVG
ncbi:AT-hook motif nuclear-localized protein 1 [Pistacia vera]|uniref:AT-hook motif nuclear-localized protein 1 n=1 Tax=Pistacia vera TaxID=55513 RepID=UPI00126304A8|nr:AT-hook motif nuclear-localized protein 1 [Pistacia vera]